MGPTPTSSSLERDSLFALAGIQLPFVSQGTAAYSALARHSFKIYGHLRSLAATELGRSLTEGTFAQLSFSFMSFKDTNIVSFVSRRRFEYLNYAVYTAFKDVPELVKFSRRIEKDGIRYLGQLVQMTEEEVLELPLMNAELLEIMKTRLSLVNFEFGMTLPLWNKAHKKQLSR